MMTTNKETINQVPHFKSLEEEAEFWDTHSPLDYPDYWKEAKRSSKSLRPLGHILGVRLDAKVIGELAAIAQSKGIGPSTLARIWLMERLEQQRSEKPRRKEPRGRTTAQVSISP